MMAAKALGPLGAAARRRLLGATRNKSSAVAASLEANEPAGEEAPKVREMREVEGPGWWWLLKLGGDPHVNTTELYEQYRDQGVAQVRDTLGNKCLIVFDQDDIKHVYQNEGKDVAGTTDPVWPLRKYFTGLGGDHADNHPLNLTLRGDRWRRTRSMLSPGIYTDAVAAYEPLVQDAAKLAVSHVTKYAPDLSRWAQFAAFDMFTSLALGKSADSADPESTSPLKEVVYLDKESLDMAVALTFLPWFMRPFNGYAKVERSFNRIVELTRAEVKGMFDQEHVPASWFKDLRDEQGISQEQLVHLMGALLSAGIGTTMGLIQWNVYALAKHTDAQAKIRAEILENLGDKPFTKSVKMPYLEAFVREVHRFYPSSSASGFRKLDHEIILPSSRVRVPAGTPLQLAGFFATRDKQFVPDADEFKPERYLRENIRARKSCPHASKLDSAVSKDPFGSGSRVCLGKRAAELEIRTLICELVRTHELALDPVDQARPGVKMGTVGLPDPLPAIRVDRLQ